MKALLRGLTILLPLILTVADRPARAQYETTDEFHVSWLLDPRDHPDVFTHGPFFGGRGVETGMDFDGDGLKEILFTTDETIAPGGPDPGQLDLFLYEATGDDTYEYVWHFTHPPSNSWPPIAYADMDGDGLWEIFLGIPTLPNEADDLLIFEQNEDGTFPEEPTVRYSYERDGSVDFRPAGFTIDDFDGDGTLELATVSRTANLRELVVIEPVGEINEFATFTIEFEAGNEILGGGSLFDVDAADFDNDGAMEIWVNTWNNFSWSIFEATGEDTYELQADIDAAIPVDDPGSYNYSKLLFHDADGDERIELFAPMTDGKLYYLDQVDDVSTITGSSFVEIGTFVDLADFSSGIRSRGGDLGDVDDDGLFEIIAGHGVGEKVSRIEYSGSGDPADSTSYTWTVILDSSADTLADQYYPLRITDDLDGDGMKEIVITNMNASDAGQPILLVLESAVPTDIDNPQELPDGFALRQNYPNPFNPSTTIEYELTTPAAATIRIHDQMGRLVATLVDHQSHAPGTYRVTWNGRNDAGAQVASGTYFYTLDTAEFRATKAMALVK